MKGKKNDAIRYNKRDQSRLAALDVVLISLAALLVALIIFFTILACLLVRCRRGVADLEHGKDNVVLHINGTNNESIKRLNR